MANLSELSQFDPVYQLERADAVDAGIAGAGVSNLQAKNLANRTKYLKDQLFIPGEIKAFAFASPPTGYLICDGSAVSRVTYVELFTNIGTVWGVGDGSTTFNLPDLRGQHLRGLGLSGLIDGTRVLGTTQAATTIGEGVNINGASEILTRITNADSSVGASANNGTAAGSNLTSKNTYGIRPDNVAVLYCIKF